MIFVLLLDGPGRIVERNKLTFLNVSVSDTQVIQCNATNKHGNIIKNVYLNVIGKCCSLMAHLHLASNIGYQQTSSVTCYILSMFCDRHVVVMWPVTCCNTVAV